MTTGWAGEQVDGDRSKRRRQVVEVLDVEVRGRDAAEEQLDVLAAVQRGGRHDAALQTELEARRIGARVGLAPDVLVGERRRAEAADPSRASR